MCWEGLGEGCVDIIHSGSVSFSTRPVLVSCIVGLLSVANGGWSHVPTSGGRVFQPPSDQPIRTLFTFHVYP